MSETKWTPGPWIDEGPNQDGERCLFGADGSAVAVTIPVGSPDLHPSRSAANARLIAAAPKLYEALDALVAIHECCDETGYVDGEGFVDVEAAVEKARAALAKARGES